MITDQYWEVAVLSLNKLAIRNNKDHTWWLTNYTCNICNSYLSVYHIKYSDRIQVVREHGMQHLKDKNLLPFL